MTHYIEDLGGNVIPDRIEANEDRYWEEELMDARIEARIEAREEWEDQQEEGNT